MKSPNTSALQNNCSNRDRKGPQQYALHWKTEKKRFSRIFVIISLCRASWCIVYQIHAVHGNLLYVAFRLRCWAKALYCVQRVRLGVTILVSGEYRARVCRDGRWKMFWRKINRTCRGGELVGIWSGREWTKVALRRGNELLDALEVKHLKAEWNFNQDGLSSGDYTIQHLHLSTSNMSICVLHASFRYNRTASEDANTKEHVNWSIE